LFFVVGPERLLADAENRLPIPKLLRLYPSDFWFDFWGTPTRGIPQYSNPEQPIPQRLIH
jgi:hypothetical protein